MEQTNPRLRFQTRPKREQKVRVARTEMIANIDRVVNETETDVTKDLREPTPAKKEKESSKSLLQKKVLFQI